MPGELTAEPVCPPAPTVLTSSTTARVKPLIMRMGLSFIQPSEPAPRAPPAGHFLFCTVSFS
jgi:hypothetical protein